MNSNKLLALAGSTLLSMTLFSSCVIAIGSNKEQNTTYAPNGRVAYAMSPTLGGKLFTAAWIQRSAEYKALCQQAYNVATERLLAATQKPLAAGEKRWAIVTDIDETIIDNSANSVYQALKGEDYSQPSWDRWCDQADAVALQGAVEFFRQADALGVDIYYISNRDEVNRAGTKKNLRDLGFPQVEDSHFMFKDKSSDKTSRRNEVLKTHNILMLLGDNLGDFDHFFDIRDEAVRDQGVLRFAAEFGKRFIVLPNPNYGAWEPAMNGGYPDLKTKDGKLTTILRTQRK